MVCQANRNFAPTHTSSLSSNGDLYVCWSHTRVTNKLIACKNLFIFENDSKIGARTNPPTSFSFVWKNWCPKRGWSLPHKRKDIQRVATVVSEKVHVTGVTWRMENVFSSYFLCNFWCFWWSRYWYWYWPHVKRSRVSCVLHFLL